MGKKVDIDDLLDSTQVAAMTNLNSPSAVSVLLGRGSFPEPVLNRGKNKVKLWLRQDIERWIRERPGSRA
jgi:predicted DNA-binding transcriptional regulator AlpA